MSVEEQPTQKGEAVTKLYEQTDRRETARTKVIQTMLENPTTRPWLEISLRCLDATESMLNQNNSQTARITNKLVALANRELRGQIAVNLAEEVERRLAVSSNFIRLFMPRGTKFDKEGQMPEDSEAVRLAQLARLYFQAHLDVLEVEGGCFPEVTFFTAPVSKHATPEPQQISVTVGDTTIQASIGEQSTAGETTNYDLFEEGLAAIWSKKFAAEVLAVKYPKGQALYKRLEQETKFEDPKLAKTRPFFLIQREVETQGQETETTRYTISTAVNDYSEGEKLVWEMSQRIPGFFRLVEQARIDGKTLALARAVETEYGKGAYRKMVTGQKPISELGQGLETSQSTTNVETIGTASGNMILIRNDHNTGLSEEYQELQWYQTGMVIAEEVYHALAPYMIHVNLADVSSPKFFIERRGMLYMTEPHRLG